jgi:hypothetical protein
VEEYGTAAAKVDQCIPYEGRRIASHRNMVAMAQRTTTRSLDNGLETLT